MHDATSVDSALALLRQHLARPSGIFDPHAALTAVDQLTDVARDKSDQRASRFGVILCQTRPLLHDSAFQQLLLKMVGCYGHGNPKGSQALTAPVSAKGWKNEELSVSPRVHFATSCFFPSRDNSVNPK